MIQARGPKFNWITLLVIAIISIAAWFSNNRSPGKESPKNRPVEQSGRPVNRSATKNTTAEKSGKYEVYRNCTLAENRANDGDSFLVRLPDGREVIIRLYFVDSPESAFKRYGGGETNFKRIRDQATDLGNITPEQAVEIGVKAKKYTLGRLASQPFTIFTEWDSPFKDDRFHAFVEVEEKGKTRWLHQLLLEQGLARIKTKPADLPDGTRSEKEREHLRNLERAARKAETGVWGL